MSNPALWLVLISLSTAVGSAQAQAPAGKNAASAKSGPLKSNDPANHFVLLKTPVELPDVPAYTGKATFVGGTQYPDDPAAKRTGLIYLVHEEDSEVLQWYQNSLASYQWKVHKIQPGTHQVIATKGNITCTVEARPYKGPGFRTEVQLGYRVGR